MTMNKKLKIISIVAGCLVAFAVFAQVTLIEHHGNTLMSGSINGSVSNNVTNFATVGTAYSGSYPSGSGTVFVGYGGLLSGTPGSTGGIATNGGIGSNNTFWSAVLGNGATVSPSNTQSTALVLTNSDGTNGVRYSGTATRTGCWRGCSPARP